MKKALISVQETITNFDNTQGYRVAEVSDIAFEVAEPLFWVDCEDTAIADQYYYDPLNNNIKELPVFDVKEINPIGGAPNVIA